MLMTDLVNDYLRNAKPNRFGRQFIADGICVQDQKMYRALKSEGTCVKHLVDAERKRRVELAIESGIRDITTLAKISGSVQLRRKFHDWYGQCPKQYLRGK